MQRIKYLTVSVIVVLWVVFLVVECRGKQNVKQVVSETKVFKNVSIPVTISDPEERANYLVRQYWNHFDFSDTTYIHLPDITEQAFVNYVDILQCVPQSIAEESIKKMLTKAEVDSIVLNYFLELYERYLYDPNSLVRNEELYIPVLEWIVASPKITEVDKIRPEYRLELAKKNRVGGQATDFEYTLASGKTGSLYALKSPYLLLYINNPDCNACREIKAAIETSDIMTKLLADKQIKILAFYPDEELDIWRKHLNEVPPTWINGYDKAFVVKNKEMYDLKAIPTLYLLDENKVVVLKDASFSMIEHFFQSPKS